MLVGRSCANGRFCTAHGRGGAVPSHFTRVQQHANAAKGSAASLTVVASRASANRHARAQRAPVVPSASPAPATTSPVSSGSLEGARTAVLWFKHDLRVDDHPGLLHAAATPGLSHTCCVFVVDVPAMRHLLLSPAGPEVLVATLTCLRSQLRALGNDLIIRVGDSAAELRSIISALGQGTALVAEAEAPGSAWARRLERTLVDSKSLPLVSTQASAWHDGPFDLNYRRWQAGRGAPSPPLGCPARLPPAPASVAPGDIPTPQKLRELLLQLPLASRSTMSLDSSDTEDVLGPSSAGEGAVLRRLAADAAATPADLLQAYLTTPASSGAAPSRSQADIDRLLARASAEQWSSQRLVGEAAAVLEPPSAPGASFNALLGPWLELGALSRRRVLQLTSGSPGTSLPAPVIPTRGAAAAKAAELSDFHHLLAERGFAENRPAGTAPSTRVMQWRWRGMRNEYYVCEPSNADTLPADAPAILLVHGFGAFGDHWRANMPALAAAGFRVFAPTLPGFGRSEKAAVPYSQDLWLDFLTDFTTNIIGRPVVVAGNSIGGFISASMAADTPDLVSGLVLLNSAGPIDPGFSEEAWKQACAKKAESAPPRLLVQLLSRALFWYLEATIDKTLKWLYPTNPARADDWLAKEIYRAACDLGSIEVFQSAFYLPPPRALNWLVTERFRGPTLVLQGALDPLNDARKRAADMASACKGAGFDIDVVLLQAGHCPHDEQPDKVNSELLAWISKRVLSSNSSVLAAVGKA